MKRPLKPAPARGVWPLPDGERRVPIGGSPGSFWEDRGDRHHCGVDLYAPPGSEVVSIDDAIVLEVGIFTTNKILPYWNETLYVLTEGVSGRFAKYAELETAKVRADDEIDAGQVLGRIGSVLNPEVIGDAAPGYIRGLRERGNLSMLHFEQYLTRPEPSERYLGGNWFGPGGPPGLHDPTDLLIALSKD